MDLRGVGARRFGVVCAFKSSVDIPLCAKGEERLTSSGNVVTLLMGDGPNLGEPWLPSKVFDEEPSGEFDSAIDDGRDWATPPKKPDWIALTPKRSPSSGSRLLSSTRSCSSGTPAASRLAFSTNFLTL